MEVYKMGNNGSNKTKDELRHSDGRNSNAVEINSRNQVFTMQTESEKTRNTDNILRSSGGNSEER